MTTPQTLKSRLYRLQSKDGEQVWCQKCQGFPLFRKEDNIFKLKFYQMPNRPPFYEVIVNSNINFERNQNGIEWTKIKQNEVMAISFKQQFSANAFWQLIEEYKRNYAVTVSAALDTLFYFQYRVPDPTVQNLNQVFIELDTIPEVQRHERVASIFLTKRQLLPKLAATFKQIDEAQNIEKLHTMFKIMKIVFNSFNVKRLHHVCFGSPRMFTQYNSDDPNFASRKPEHRQFMKSQAKLLQVVPFKNSQLVHLIIITYRLQYVKECVLSAYLNDYAIYCSTFIIKNNYKKILNYIFNPKKKDFINTLFDMLRSQQLMAYRLLEEIFRIGKTINADEIYLQIAEKDFFEIIIRNMKEDSGLQLTNNKLKKKKTPEYLTEIVKIGLEILVQFMETQPLHLKTFCISETEKISKYPTLDFLMEYYVKSSTYHQKVNFFGVQIKKILSILVATDNPHPIKDLTHEKIVQKILKCDSHEQLLIWAPIFSKIIIPYSNYIDENISSILTVIIKYLNKASKHNQILILSIIKDLVFTYLDNPVKVCLMNQFCEQFAIFLASNKGSLGIRVSTLLCILRPSKFHSLAKGIMNAMKNLTLCYMDKYIQLLDEIIKRQQVQLDSTLKRQRSQQLYDQENFEKIGKKVKIT